MQYSHKQHKSEDSLFLSQNSQEWWLAVFASIVVQTTWSIMFAADWLVWMIYMPVTVEDYEIGRNM